MARRKVTVTEKGKGRKSSGPAAQAGHDSLLVYVHGIGKHEPAEELKLQWDLALFGRDMGDRSCMAYWSDLVHPPGAGVGKRSVRSRGTDDAFDLDAALERAGVSAGNEDAQAFARSLLRELGVEEEVAVKRTGKKIMPLPSWLRKPISRAFLEAFVADTAAYFFKEGMREKIRSRLRKQMQLPASRSVTVVAHSLGSVIAYEVLSAMGREALNLDALVTIGSPLGIREVQDFLDPDTRAIPGIVPRWWNFADPLDPVAADKGLASDFNGVDVAIDDEMIVNDKTRKILGFNPHSAVGYLAHPKVRRAVNEAMRLDKMARFVIARDVAERLGDEAEQRHPVLIEVLEPGYAALGETGEEMTQMELRESQVLKRRGEDVAQLSLRHRIDGAAAALRKVVSDEEAACIDTLRRFVAARLTAPELRRVGAAHRDMRVYAVWRSSRKSKLTDQRGLRAIKADAALSGFNADGMGITWAVLDTGVRADHPHLAGVVDEVWDCTKPGRPVRMKNARDSDGHGTHVAGIIAGSSPDGLRRGVAPRARLVIYKVLDDKGLGEDAWIIKALDHIAEQNENMAGGLAIHGVNLSLGGPFDTTVYGCGFSPICAELRRLWRNGVLVVTACGNEGQLKVQTPDGETDINTAMSIGDPANLDDCIAVGSVNADLPHLYGVSAFSSRGPTADGRAKPDVVAPGERILSCNARYRGDQDLYFMESGTSMAAPHVSGLLAAFLSVRREFRGRPDEVKRILLDSCVDLGRDRYHQGRGLPNLMKMLLAV